MGFQGERNRFVSRASQTVEKRPQPSLDMIEYCPLRPTISPGLMLRKWRASYSGTVSSSKC